jgi:hypothetical protein
MGISKSSKYANFLIDFGLKNWKTWYTLSPAAIERFARNETFQDKNGGESDTHFRVKDWIRSHVYGKYSDWAWLVTTELEQKNNPFNSYLDGNHPVFYTLDVCMMMPQIGLILDFEVDGKEHYTSTGLMKGKIRDEKLHYKYGIYTMRINKDDPPTTSKIDKFIETSLGQYLQEVLCVE